MANNYNTSGEDVGANMGNQRPAPLRRPLPETEAKLLNGNPGQDKPKGRPILGAQQVSHQIPPNFHPSQLGYPNQNQNQHLALSSQPWSAGSGLSANAPEFVPGQAYPSSLSVNAPEFVPRSLAYPPAAQLPESQFNVPMSQAEMEQYENEERLYEHFHRLVSIRPPHLSSSSSVRGSGAVELIKSTIHYLTTNPGQVDSYMMSVVTQLHQQTLDDGTVNKIVELLIEQGISEPNFRYTGAKMCQLLSKHLIASKFRQCFLKRFQQEFLKKDEWIKDPSQHHRICGLTLFLGELFLNMEVERADGAILKYAALRMALKDALFTLLSHVTDLTVKATCQLLKLSGAAIQDTENLNSTEGPNASYDDIFKKLEAISQYPNLSQTSRLLLSSVLSLKDTNWGRKDSTSSESSQDPASTWDGLHFALNEPVFYDEHGQPISREQAGFYADEGEEDFSEYAFDSGDVAYPAWANDDSAYDPYPYDLSCNVYGAEGDMDDEMEAAYEEFLRSQGQS